MTSQHLPPSTFFYGTSSSLSVSVPTGNTTATQTTKENKRRGENSRPCYLHGLSFLHKHKNQMTTDPDPWTCLSSRMLAPLDSVVIGSFLSLGCIEVPRDEWVNLSLNIWDLHQKSRVPYCTALERSCPWQTAGFHVRDICIHAHKEPINGIS